MYSHDVTPSSHAFVSAPMARSPGAGEKYQAHSRGPSLICKAYDLLMEVFPGRLSRRDPINRDQFIAKLQSPARNPSDEEFLKWMTFLGITAENCQKISSINYSICPAFLIGDCFLCRENLPKSICVHGHPNLKIGVDPLSYPLVLENCECIRLAEKGTVKVSKVLGYDQNNKNSIYPKLILGEERNEGKKSCKFGKNCTREDCFFAHDEEPMEKSVTQNYNPQFSYPQTPNNNLQFQPVYYNPGFPIPGTNLSNSNHFQLYNPSAYVPQSYLSNQNKSSISPQNSVPFSTQNNNFNSSNQKM